MSAQVSTPIPTSAEANTNGLPSAQEVRWVYLFDELDQAEKDVQPKTWDDMKALLGGKGANLAEMTRIGVPVPPGFTVTTRACNAYMEFDRNFPPGMWEQEVAAMCTSSRRRPARSSATRATPCSSPAARAPSSPCPA